MTITWNGIIQCPFCNKFFETTVSTFYHFETEEEMELEKRTSHYDVCPYCRKTLKDTPKPPNEYVVYNPTLKENRMTQEQILKIQPTIERGTVLKVVRPKPSVIDKVKKTLGLK
ncbi:Uncharacterised protein [Candidatus Bilamarchaeum dharawalense]|uniref:Uncharacterized protein n=1 Tax=Candidatus Bilamarchaeum dharawalense TaxID=2885759 RepID=A0A5E4LWJ4_9ARCH|nr:Uncharacterised protein [Candidatus Bilamarchaeum dharawalense]